MTRDEIEKRFQESIELARSLGVPEELILHDEEEVERFFNGDSAE